MKAFFGLDIGGTKIGGAAFSPEGNKLLEIVRPTPKEYATFLTVCQQVVTALDEQIGVTGTVGVGLAGAIGKDGTVNAPAPSMGFLAGTNPRTDLERLLGRAIRIANDANCMALAEAIDGAGQGYASVCGLILGTGAGGGFILDGQIVCGANGMAGEIGHIPLPFREESDGLPALCNSCRQVGCIDQTISGGGLTRLYTFLTGNTADSKTIGAMAKAGDKDALRVLDRYFETVAKATVVILHSFDPDVIVVSGGLNQLPGLYDEVPKRWGRYVVMPNAKTKFLPAIHGVMSGVRGAAWLWR